MEREHPISYRVLGVQGLGGWLILVQIGLYGALFSLAAQFFLSTLSGFSPEIWPVLTSPDSELYYPLFGPVLIFEAVKNVLFMAFTIFILVCFYRKKRIVPRLMIMFYSLLLLISIIDAIIIYQIPAFLEPQDGKAIRTVIREGLTCAIFIPYFLKSERVENTFVQ
ncbi:DUF2569 domain-containing protein [Paenibacillus sp. 1P07SE]|uniref:DUF2569 domain-containing protein n=1 Tax=Paenibacillus sp. 1P07SE TaxID=3132209 RepID=UPI0039A507EE